MQSLIDKKELERWQKHFCDMAHIFVCCVDGNDTPLTEFGGNAEDWDQLRKVIDNEQFYSMLQRVSESTLEEQAIESTPSVCLISFFSKPLPENSPRME